MRHQLEAGDALDGPLAAEIADRIGGVPVAQGGALYVGGDTPPDAEAGWTRVAHEARGDVWRRRDPVAVPSVAVLDDPVPGTPLEHPTFLAWTVDGRGDPGGELVFEVFVRPPQVTAMRPCVVLRAGEARLDLGVLLDGRLALVPGAPMRPLYRHRARVDVPDDWPGVTDRVAGELILEDCRTGADLSDPVAVQSSVSGSRVSVDRLAARGGVPDPEAVAASLKPPRQSLHKQPDGRIEVREGPALPRMLRGDAWGVFMLPALDPRGWPEVPADGTAPRQPLAPLLPQLTEAESAIVGWDAVASRVGRASEVSAGPPRRVVPETMNGLRQLGIDGVLLGPHRHDAGVEGLEATVAAANRLGLRTDAGGVTVIAGDSDRAVAVRIIGVPTVEAIPASVQAAREAAPGALVFVQVEADDGSARVGSGLRGLADRGEVDAVWTLSAGPTTVEVASGVPILRGWSPLDAAARQGLAVRWYAAPEGVPRIDLITLVRRGGQWERDRDGRLRPWLVDLAGRSRELDTYVVVGKTVAAVDVGAHGPHVRDPLATTVPLPTPDEGPLPAPSRPARCDADAVPVAAGTPLGAQLALESAEVVDGEPSAGEPVRVRLVWRRRGSAALPPGRVQWSATGLTPPWRPSSQPCEGSWGFERWTAGERVLDEVALYPPEGVTGTATLQLQVRLGDQVARPPSGERWIDVGEVRVGAGGG